MTIPANDGCPWPVDPACLGDSWDTDFDEPTKNRAIALASATLRRLTGYRVGGCPIKVRPCTPARLNTWMGAAWYDQGFIPINWSGIWTNCSCNPCVGACGETTANTLALPGLVTSVSEVKVDGAVKVAGTHYRVDGNKIYAISPFTWPTSQDLTKPDTATGTFSVTYLNSYPVDGMGAYAAGQLAYQFAQACSGGDCDLPATVTQVVRQGVSYTLAAGSFPNGETGLREVDAYIGLWNPGHRTRPPMVWSP